MTFPERPSRARRSGRSARVALLPVALLACATGSEGEPLPADAEAREAEIAALEARVERDREALAGMVTTPRDLEAAPFHDDPELRAVAERLTADAERLERLRAERGGAGAGDSSGDEQ